MIDDTNEKKVEKLYIVRLYDGFDNAWCDVSEPVSYDEANRILAEKTNRGTYKTNFNDIDYYKVFPADTTMLFKY